MVYLTRTDMERSGGGFGYTDFKEAGVTMTEAQWIQYCDLLIASVTSAINRYCRIGSFESATYTEYHDGSGASGDLGEYTERDRIFLLREQPVISITSVSEDVAATINAPSWTARVQRTSTTPTGTADYQLLTRGGSLSYLYFVTNVPAKGKGNLKVVYLAGYAATSDVIDDIRIIALQIIDNIFSRRKRLQEANAARMTGTKDSADMFKLDADGAIFTPDIRMQLDKYRRQRAGGTAWR